MHNFIETPICMGKERVRNPVHPTQKLVKVLKRIIEIASNHGDLVLDPFMGVGSTGAAALGLNRRFSGIEVDSDYYRAAQERLQDFSSFFSHSLKPEVSHVKERLFPKHP